MARWKVMMSFYRRVFSRRAGGNMDSGAQFAVHAHALTRMDDSAERPGGWLAGLGWMDGWIIEDFGQPDLRGLVMGNG